MSMKNYFNEIDVALKHKLYYLALFSSLTVPDICGAISSQDGTATGAKYKEWFNKYYPKKVTIKDIGEIDNPMNAENCWSLRCSILHQGSSKPNGFKQKNSLISKQIFNKKSLKNGSSSAIFDELGMQYSRIIFTLALHGIVHGNVTTHGSDIELNIDIELFCRGILEGADKWLQQNEYTANYQQNVSKFLQHYPLGFGGIIGIPVLSNT